MTDSPEVDLRITNLYITIFNFFQAVVFIPSLRFLENHHQKVTVMVMVVITMLTAQVTKRKVTEDIIIIIMITMRKERGPLGGILNQGHLSALNLHFLALY